ncbi:hypothetical protein [Algoriphagus formosus]|uniref:hypothetical protein n=1 Tax=Algoriphagus formosus TaxID=2007308 RepID=UPI000C29517F|nr:hypothetical protein [Algoriphagus formosus]
MPFLHKYQQHNFGNGFETHHSILDIVPYEPEVIFIGTNNHGWSWNQSDFYYGRDMYMWTILANLFIHGKNHLTKTRNANNNKPTKEEIFEICKKGKIVFADIVKGIKNEIPAQEIKNEKHVLVNNQYRWGGKKRKKTDFGAYSDGHLDFMGKEGWLDDNVEAIVQYLNQTPSIKHVYFTFKSGEWLKIKLKEIQNEIRKDVSSASIFTPTGNGFGLNLGAPFNKKPWSLTHCWVWNSLEHQIPINRPGYGHLDHDWLRSKGVNPENF